MIGIVQLLFTGKPVASDVHINIHDIFYVLLPIARLGNAGSGNTLQEQQ
jgi:hypothetical protein